MAMRWRRSSPNSPPSTGHPGSTGTRCQTLPPRALRLMRQGSTRDDVHGFPEILVGQTRNCAGWPVARHGPRFHLAYPERPAMVPPIGSVPALAWPQVRGRSVMAGGDAERTIPAAPTPPAPAARISAINPSRALPQRQASASPPQAHPALLPTAELLPTGFATRLPAFSQRRSVRPVPGASP